MTDPGGTDDDPDRLADVVSLDPAPAGGAVDHYLGSMADATRSPGIGPDTDAVLARLDHALPSPPAALRILVATLASVELVAVLPWLVGADPFGLLGGSTSAHLTRDGAMGLVVAAAGFLAAWRPHWARPSFTIASIALVAQAAAGAIDRSGSAGTSEAIHLSSVVLTCLTGMLAIRLTTRRNRLGPPSPPG